MKLNRFCKWEVKNTGIPLPCLPHITIHLKLLVSSNSIGDKAFSISWEISDDELL